MKVTLKELEETRETVVLPAMQERGSKNYLPDKLRGPLNVRVRRLLHDPEADWGPDAQELLERVRKLTVDPSTLPSDVPVPKRSALSHADLKKLFDLLGDEVNRRRASSKGTPQFVVFYCWQSDLPGRVNRNFIRDALAAAATLVATKSGVKVTIDQDTKNVAGSPIISETILKKIAEANGVIFDTTFVTSPRAKRKCPNPNVMLEAGFGIGKLEWDRVVAVLNTRYGKVEDLPFDMRHRRCTVTYRLDDGATAQERKQVREKLAEELAKVINGWLGKAAAAK